MSEAKLRVLLRWVHIILGLVLMCYVYSPLGEAKWFQIAIKFIVLPAIVLTGVWIWKFQLLNKSLGIKKVSSFDLTQTSRN